MAYLRNPLAALEEMRQVLKSNEVIGIRDANADGQLVAPIDRLLTQTFSDYWRLIEHDGGNRYVGRRQRALLRQA